jgi:hypothetical protein
MGFNLAFKGLNVTGVIISRFTKAQLVGNMRNLQKILVEYPEYYFACLNERGKY